jgi:cytochrome d ubiquinol oxidase subunit II
MLALLAARSQMAMSLGAPLMGRALTTAPWAPALHLATGAAAVTAIAALWRRRYRLARVAAAGRVSPILGLWALTAGGLVLFPSLVYLLRVFKREPARS